MTRIQSLSHRANELRDLRDLPQEHEIHQLLGRVWVDAVARDEDAVVEGADEQIDKQVLVNVDGEVSALDGALDDLPHDFRRGATKRSRNVSGVRVRPVRPDRTVDSNRPGLSSASTAAVDAEPAVRNHGDPLRLAARVATLGNPAVTKGASDPKYVSPSAETNGESAPSRVRSRMRCRCGALTLAPSRRARQR